MPSATLARLKLFGDAAEEGARSFLAFYAARTAKATRPQDVSDEQFRTIAHGGFLGDLLILAGFRYTALDIFHATNTILFDLNIHAPGPRLASQFDLVTNFGTTEHVINQLRAFQTIHDLTRPQGLIYHDLPLAGYLNHALFRYDPLFFRTVVATNDYDVILQEITMGPRKSVPAEVVAMGYGETSMADVGIEMIVRRTNAEPFKVPMETTTSLSVDPAIEMLGASEAITLPEGTMVSYGGTVSLDDVDFGKLTQAWLRQFPGVLRRRARRLLSAGAGR